MQFLKAMVVPPFKQTLKLEQKPAKLKTICDCSLHSMTVYRWNASIAPLILILGLR